MKPSFDKIVIQERKEQQGGAAVDSVWIKLFIMLAVFGTILFFINKAMRKWLGVEKKEVFSYNHVNEKHKKIDWTIRILTILFMGIGFTLNVNRDPSERIWFLETYFLLIVFIFATEIARVAMEKKYAENKKDYIFTTFQLVMISLFFILIYLTDFFGILG